MSLDVIMNESNSEEAEIFNLIFKRYGQKHESFDIH